MLLSLSAHRAGARTQAQSAEGWQEHMKALRLTVIPPDMAAVSRAQQCAGRLGIEPGSSGPSPQD